MVKSDVDFWSLTLVLINWTDNVTTKFAACYIVGTESLCGYDVKGRV